MCTSEANGWKRNMVGDGSSAAAAMGPSLSLEIPIDQGIDVGMSWNMSRH